MGRHSNSDSGSIGYIPYSVLLGSKGSAIVELWSVMRDALCLSLLKIQERQSESLISDGMPVIETNMTTYYRAEC